MAPRKITEGVFSVGAIDWDRRLFDSLIPLPFGTSYNAYLVQGESKTALLDAVEPALQKDLFANLDELGVKSIDYVVCHHAEQDHSGSIPAVLERFPGARVVTNQKCADLLVSHLRIDSSACDIVADGAVLDLGGKSLQFTFAPWVHWPETMLSFLREDRILFTCDFLGSHLATGMLYADDEHSVYLSAKRYYAEIMMPFRGRYPAYLQKIEAMAPAIIAPSHGPIYRRPAFILDAYKDWTSDHVKNEAVIGYVSMHGSTKIMVDRLVDRLVGAGVNVKQFDLATVDIGELAMALVDPATLVLATPTVLGGPHPAAVYAAYLASAIKPKLRHAAIIGSQGWGGKTVDTLKSLLAGLKVEMLEPLMSKGLPKPEDLAGIDKLAEAIQARHAALG
ncbi:MAG: FprA family A-type flavoprotein [Deltaproteobacteria bacterium]|nr:FprA family A-type flavoprotein [Deltaproteobacteria bacterium]